MHQTREFGRFNETRAVFSRQLNVKRIFVFLLGALSLFGLISGCTSAEQNRLIGEIAGVVTDLNGEVVRNARVFVNNNGQHVTFSNEAGTYLLTGVPEGDNIVYAELNAAGVRYYGQNYARVFEGERTKSVNITMGRENQFAKLEGVVLDRFGNLLVGARIVADAGTLGSTMAISDENGEYLLGGLFGGVNYRVYASGRGYDSDVENVTLASQEVRPLNFTLSNGSNVSLPTPQNLSAVAWTSHTNDTNQPNRGDYVEAIKRIYDPKRATKQRVTANKPLRTFGGNEIEIDLTWDPITSASLLGYGIYRGTSQTGPVAGLDFLPDPLTYFYADLDEDLREAQNYYYEITALNVLYPDTPNSESVSSNRYGVRPIGDLNILSVLQNPLRFRWNPANEAEEYVVFLFDEYPNIGVSPIWDSSATTIVGTQFTYNGPNLQQGRRYYWLVLGLANNNDSRTISQVGEFVAN